MNLRFVFLMGCAALSALGADAAKVPKTAKAPKPPDDLTTIVGDGYRGIWYMNQRVEDEYHYKYSGGFAAYPQQHVPIAIYVGSPRKTFVGFGCSAGNVSAARDQLQPHTCYFDLT